MSESNKRARPLSVETDTVSALPQSQVGSPSTGKNKNEHVVVDSSSFLKNSDDNDATTSSAATSIVVDESFRAKRTRDRERRVNASDDDEESGGRKATELEEVVLANGGKVSRESRVERAFLSNKMLDPQAADRGR